MRNYLKIGLSFVISLFSFSHLEAQQHIVFTPQWTPQAQFAGYYVAKEKGFYKEVGLEVEIVHPKVSQPGTDCVIIGDSQVTSLQLCQALEVVDKGMKLVNILQTSMNEGMMIMSARGKNPLTQKGARLGITSMSEAQLAICLSKKEGLDYQLVPAAGVVSLYMDGAVDGIVGMSYNELYQLMQSGVQLTENEMFRFADHGYNIQGEGLYMTYDYYSKHRREARDFAKASRRGWEWVAEHPDEAMEIVSKYIKAGRTATNRELQRLMLREVLRLQLDKQTGKREFRLKPDMVRQASQLMHEYGILSREVQYLELIER